MIDCEALRDDLKAYLDGELPLARRRAVRRHLAGCASCREEVRGMTRIGGALRAAEDAADRLNPVLREKIRAGLAGVTPEPSPEPSRGGFPWRRYSLAACGAAASIALAYLLVSPVFLRDREKAGSASSTSAPRQTAASRPETRVAQAPAVEQAPITRSSPPLEKREKSEDRIATKAARPARPEPSAPAPPRRRVPQPSSGAAASAGAQAPAPPPAAMPASPPAIEPADIAVEVAGIEEASAEIARMVRSAGGFVADRRLDTKQEGVAAATLILQIPAARVVEIRGRIAGLEGEMPRSLRDEAAPALQEEFAADEAHRQNMDTKKSGRPQVTPALSTLTVRLREKAAGP